MASDNNKVSIRIEAIDEYTKVLGAAGQAGRKLSQDFANLNIRSALDIQVEKARMVASFEAIKKSGIASADEIKLAYKALQSRLSEIDQNPKKVATGLQGVASMLAQVFALERVVTFTKASFDASLAIDSITSKLKVMSGSNALAAKEWEYIRSESKRLGLALLETADSYSTFAVATKGSSIEGAKTKEIFSAISEAITALHLPAEKASAVIYQFQQMVSKGKLSMEDLKTASESFPGLMGMIASSLNITTSELMKQMAAGNLMAADVLPKLAEQLHKTYGQAAEEAATKGRAAMNGFKTETFQLMSQIGQDVGPGIIVIAKVVTAVTKAIMVTVQTAGQALAFLFESVAVYFDPTTSISQKIAKFKALGARLVDGARENANNYFGETKKLAAADKESLEDKIRNDQRRRNEAKKTGEDLAKSNLEYAKQAGDVEAQLSAEMDKQYEERKKIVIDFYNQKKAYSKNDIEEVTAEQSKKLKLIEIERQHARDLEIVKVQRRALNLAGLKNEVDMETLLIREKVSKNVITERQGEQRITALVVASNRMQYESKKAVTDKYAEIYGRDSEEYKKLLQAQETAHKEFLSSRLSAYQKYSDQIKKFDQEIRDFRMSIEERIRDAQQKTMTDSQKYADDQQRVNEALARSKAALTAGNKDLALKENELALSLASRLLDKKVETDNKMVAIEKERVARIEEINNQSLGAQTDQQKKTADIAKVNADAAQKQLAAEKERRTVLDSVTITQTAYKQILEQQTAINQAQTQEVKAARDELQKIADIKIDTKTFAVAVEGSSLNLVKSVISDLTKTETKTILINTVGGGSYSGSTTGFFAGGKVAGGSPLRDSVSAMLAKNEWVINNRAAGFWGDNVMAAINNPLSAAGQQISAMIRSASPANAAPLGTLNLQVAGGTFPVQGPIDVLSQLTTAVRRLQKTRPQ